MGALLTELETHGSYEVAYLLIDAFSGDLKETHGWESLRITDAPPAVPWYELHSTELT